MSQYVGLIEVCRRLGAVALLTSLAVSSGCGSSGQDGQYSATGTQELLKSDDIHRYEGKGKNKQKVSLSRNERFKLRAEAKKKLEDQE